MSFRDHFRQTLHIRHLPVLITVLFLSTWTSAAQPVFYEQNRALPQDMSMGMLAPSEYRMLIDLNGSWEYRDPASSDWKQIRIPSSYKGRYKFVFRRDFSVPRALAPSAVFQITALSISYYCEISINGQFVGKHAGLTSFSFKISPGIIKPGRNTIEILVHNFLDTHETIPLYEQMWDRLNYGGIVHDIGIVAHRGVWVEESYVRTDVSGEGRPATLHCRAFLNSGELSALPADSAGTSASFGRSTVSYVAEVLDALTGNVVAGSEMKRVEVESDRLREVDVTVSLPTVRLWSTETPNLYVLRQRTMRGGRVLDETMQQIGFRSLRVRDGQLQLNGSPLFVKAMTYMEDSPWHGRSLSLDEMERDILMMKNLGINTVRLAAGSTHPLFMGLCDRYGIMVMHDIPLQDVPESILEKDAIRSTARNLLREAIARDYNHPSLIAVGLARGVQTAGRVLSDYIEQVVSVARQTETPLIYVSFQSMLPTAYPERLDFVGIDVMPLSDTDATSLLTTLADRQPEDVPVIISGLSYPVQIGNYNGYSDPRSIDAQGEFYLRLFKIVRDLGFDGIGIHAFADWAVSRPIMSVDRVYQYTATGGIVDRYRQKRLSYDVLKASFNNEKPPVLVTGNFEEKHPVSFVVFGILAILIFAVVYNLFRRFRENVVRSFLRPYNFYADVRDQRMLSIFQTSMVGLLGSLSAALLFANLLYFWRMNILVEKAVAQFIHHAGLKQWINFAAWSPLENILLMTAMFFFLLILFAFLLRFGALISRKKVFLFDAYSVSMWSVLPMIMLAPFGMILYRIMEIPSLEIIAVITYVVFHIWVISRMFKGTAIVFDIRPMFFYLAGYLLIGAGIAAVLISLNSEYEIMAYLRYYVHLWWSVAQIVS
ncbi:MAG: hypothetical protein JXA28_00550 [Bacteroidetes bacterium]|nr:hypothetical protein [Bacteroidota bacterium]